MIPFLSPFAAPEFPDLDLALDDPDGLLAAGGNLTVPWLLAAYSRGIFPWYSEGDPILWWCPDPRIVFHTNAIHLSRRFRRRMRQQQWDIRFDRGFKNIIESCAHIERKGQSGTWITEAMCAAYIDMYREGYAHCVEVLDHGQIIGGLYGVVIGRMFFAESMFSAVPGASKIALAALADLLNRHGFELIDAQLDNPHLRLMGAKSLNRDDFLLQIERLTALPHDPLMWAERMTSGELLSRS